MQDPHYTFFHLRISKWFRKELVLALVHLFIIPVRQKSHHSRRAPMRTGWGCEAVAKVIDVAWLRSRVRKAKYSKQAGTQEEQDCYRG